MKSDNIHLEIGDSVKVKEGIMCPDLEDLCIEGWRGEVSEVGEDKDGNALICIRWDRLTLKNLPDYFIEQSEEEGLACSSMYLWQEDVELAEGGDTREDTTRGMDMSRKVGRNDPCPCGSGKKYKRCCLKNKEQTTPNQSSQTIEKSPISRLTIARIVEDAKEDPEMMREYGERSNGLTPETNFEEFLRGLWDREKLRKMSTEEIIDKLGSMNVEFDKTCFKEQTQNYISASRLADDCYSARDLGVEGPDEDFVWLAILELWKRLSPEQINIEMIDDAMQDGYKLIGNGNCIGGVKEWVAAWDMIRAIVPPHIKSVWDADQFLPEPLTQSIYNWCQNFEMELHNAGIDDESYFLKRIRYCREFCDIFPDTDESILHNMYRAEAESYMVLGAAETADKLFKELVDEFPDNIWGYVGWGDMYCFGRYSEKIPPDCDRAEEIYRMGLARCDTDADIDVIYERLEGLDEARTGAQ